MSWHTVLARALIAVIAFLAVLCIIEARARGRAASMSISGRELRRLGNPRHFSNRSPQFGDWK